MDALLPPLIAALSEPERYPEAVKQVELVQTHISWVLLAGEFAYKIKKPLHLSYLDFSTLALRRHFCEEELRLNRRFAPDIYQEVVGIYGTADHPQWHGSGEPIEYAVKMRRFDEAGRLDHLCARGELTAAHLSDLADTLVAFHQSAASATTDSLFGQPASIQRAALDNFTDLFALLPEATVQARLTNLRNWTEASYKRLASMMHDRLQQGWVRECHGDLHLGNLVLIDQRVRLFDGLEFNDALRWTDVACEIAFTSIDLLAHAQPCLANWFLNEVLSRSGDYQSAQLLPFYAVYRALVRAKVAALRAQQTQVNSVEALDYLALAEHLAAPAKPQLLITHGLSGCGKTFVTDALLQRKDQPPTLRLRSDVERKRLNGLAATAHSGSSLSGGIYTPDAHTHTYDHLKKQAELLLCAGWSVIVDAAFLRHDDRAAFARLADDCGVGFGILAPAATPAQLRERILARIARGQDASEANLAVLARQTDMLEPLTTQELLTCQTLDIPMTAI
jgi:aminoglycoside phosphotransferase family enzyme/predicted kinase